MYSLGSILYTLYVTLLLRYFYLITKCLKMFSQKILKNIFNEFIIFFNKDITHDTYKLHFFCQGGDNKKVEEKK